MDRAEERDSGQERTVTKRILIVDDEPSTRRTLQLMLGAVGSCDAHQDGGEAVQAVERALMERRPYDLICLDIQMNRMDGQEALQKIRKAEANHGLAYGRGARVVMTTSMADTRNVMSAFHGMCDAYLVKPVTRQRLFDALRELGMGIDSQRG